MGNLILSLVFTSSWFGHAIGLLMYENLLVHKAITWFFICAVFVANFLVVAKSRYKDCYIGSFRVSFIRNIAYVIVYLYLLFGLVTLAAMLSSPLPLGAFRMHFFDVMVTDPILKYIFLMFNIIGMPFVVVLSLINFGVLSALANVALLQNSVATNSRGGVIYSVTFYLLRNFPFITKRRLGLIAVTILLYLIISTIVRLAEGEGEGEGNLADVLLHIVDYFTISAGVYREYANAYNLGSYWGQFAFLNSIASKIFQFKAMEGQIADISSEVLFYTNHGTGPFNAFFTFLGFFPADIMGVITAFVSLLGYAILVYKSNSILHARYFNISVLISGFVPFVFSLQWFVGFVLIFFMRVNFNLKK